VLTIDSDILAVVPESIPASLKAKRRWVCWKGVEKARRDGTIELSKQPRQASRPSANAKTSDRATWGTFAQAVAAYNGKQVDGVGFVLCEGFLGIDLDSVRNPVTGELDPAARAIIERLDTYTEVSPSGQGVKAILRGSVPESRKRPADGIAVEIYGTSGLVGARYFTLTGHHLPGTPAEVADADGERMAEVMRLWEQMAKPQPSRPMPLVDVVNVQGDDDIIELGHKLCRGFGSLWAGESSGHDGDASAGDLALASHLAWLCGPHSETQICRLLMRSGRRRDKFERHRTYLERTAAKALDGKSDFFKPSQPLGVVRATQPAGVLQLPAAQQHVVEQAEWTSFPVALLPTGVRDYVTETAAGMGCDPAMMALPTLAALAAAIGNTRTIMLKADWQEPAVLWTAIVAESGSLKTPAMRKSLRFAADRERVVEDRNAAVLAQYDADKLAHEADLAAWKQAARRDRNSAGQPPVAPSKPSLETLIVGDATVEAIGPILGANARGVLLARDELASWLGGFDRYKSGGAGRVSSEVGLWLSMHNAEELRIDRKSTGRLYVPRATCSITGGIQPDTLTQAIGQEHVANGLLARFLIAAPPRKPKRFNTATAGFVAVEAARSLYETLYAIPMPDDGPRSLPLARDAEAIWESFYDRHAVRQNEAAGVVASMLAKAEAAAARLALVCHVCRQAGGESSLSNEVDVESITAGIGMAEWFAAEWLRVYDLTIGGGAEKSANDAGDLLEWIAGQGGQVAVRDIGQRLRRYRDADKLERTITGLIHAGSLESFSVHGDGGGRPAYWVRLPTLAGGFLE